MFLKEFVHLIMTCGILRTTQTIVYAIKEPDHAVPSQCKYSGNTTVLTPGLLPLHTSLYVEKHIRRKRAETLQMCVEKSPSRVHDPSTVTMPDS